MTPWWRCSRQFSGRTLAASGMARTLLILGISFFMLAALAHRIQVGCPGLANATTSQGWLALDEGRADDARDAFERAHFRCPEHVGARTGLGFVALRAGDNERAHRWFDEVLAGRPENADALVGRAMLAWREDDLERVHEILTRVLELDPSRADALEYMALLPEGFGPPPERPPLIRPDTLVYPARARANRFEIRTANGGWQPFYVNGVNIGAALPGRFASEFPDSATYADWFAGIADVGANSVRVYTIHPPAFYKALLDHNSRAAQPLWLIHGVWAELPPADNYDDPAWKAEFEAEMRAVVDIVHGRADVRPRAGHASGHYLADVSRWTLGFVLGREWEPYSVIAYNQRVGARSSFHGRYIELDQGTPMDVWLAEVCDYIVGYESRTYNTQRPIAYTNWPTLDPLSHITEATLEEDAAMRARHGEVVKLRGQQHEEDAASLDAALVRPTAALPAGYFAAYHVYPYYPDFMVLDPDYNSASSPLGKSNYFGYLTDLKQHHGNLPVLIAEYGVPGSVGISHIQPDGWHHGGLEEAEKARIASRMTREIAMAGMAGGILFAWIDEWFKKNWLTQEFAVPAERNRLWLNRLDPEQQYGVIAMEPVARIPGRTLEERLTGWRGVRPLYTTEDGVRVRAVADEAVLHLLIETGTPLAPSELLVGFDLATPESGSFRFPGAGAPASPVGIEFLLRATREDVRLLVSPEANPFDIDPDTAGLAKRSRPRGASIQNPPPGFFQDRVRQVINIRRQPTRRDDGRFDPLRVVPNRLRFGRDGVEYLAMGYDRGILPGGNGPDGFWEWLEDGSVLEVRIPWMLLNVTDPSSRSVLRIGSSPEPDGTLPARPIPGIGLVVALRADSASWRVAPSGNRTDDVAVFTWDTWEKPQWQARRRPIYDALRDTYHSLDRQLVNAGTNR
jgi:hypothetical protein